MLITAEYEKYLIPVTDGYMIDPQAPEQIKQELIFMNKKYEEMYGEKLFIEPDDKR